MNSHPPDIMERFEATATPNTRLANNIGCAIGCLVLVTLAIAVIVEVFAAFGGGQ